MSTKSNREEIESLTQRYEGELADATDLRAQVWDRLTSETDDEYVDKVTTRIRNATDNFTKAIDNID